MLRHAVRRRLKPVILGLLLLTIWTFTSISLSSDCVTSLQHDYDVNERADDGGAQVSKPDAVAAPKREHRIVLYTSYRSGSSFFGEIFRQNREAFYLFEPLKVLSLQRNDEAKRALLTRPAQYLADGFNCDFHPLFEDAHAFFPDQRKLLSSWTRRIFEQQIERHQIRTPTLEVLEAMCRQYNIKVQKIIRGRKLSAVTPLMVNNVSDVIVLIRDPRAVAVSRLELESIRPKQEVMTEKEKQTYLMSAAKECCDKYGDVVNFFKQEPRDGALYRSVSHRLSIVRFEDIALNPIDIATKVYTRLGIQMPDTVTTWLTNATRGSDQAAGFETKYLTQRDSRAVTDKWRRKLPLATVVEMQRLCPETYHYLGYKLVSSESELLSQTETVLTDPDFGLDLLIS